VRKGKRQKRSRRKGKAKERQMRGEGKKKVEECKWKRVKDKFN
jgi:hypothetical protein